MDLGLWISFGIIGTVIWIVLIRYGIKCCLKNNAMGVFILFVTLNIFGLVLGWAILWNNKNILKDNFGQDAEKLSKIREERKKQNKFIIKKFKKWREKRIKEKEEKNKLTAKEYREWREKRIKEKEEKNNN